MGQGFSNFSIFLNKNKIIVLSVKKFKLIYIIYLNFYLNYPIFLFLWGSKNKRVYSIFTHYTVKYSHSLRTADY